MLIVVPFLILRRRERQLERPFRAGGRRVGMMLSALGVILTAALLPLSIPGMPASVDVMAYVFLGLWWLLGMVFLLRIPRGIAPGPDAEERLLTQRGRTL